MSVFPEYLSHALEKEREQATWELWMSLYPYMNMGWAKQVKYDEFKRELFRSPAIVTPKAPDEIDAEMSQVVASYEKINRK